MKQILVSDTLHVDRMRKEHVEIYHLSLFCCSLFWVKTKKCLKGYWQLCVLLSLTGCKLFKLSLAHLDLSIQLKRRLVGIYYEVKFDYFVI